jgi:hypothetical protein
VMAVATSRSVAGLSSGAMGSALSGMEWRLLIFIVDYHGGLPVPLILRTQHGSIGRMKTGIAAVLAISIRLLAQTPPGPVDSPTVPNQPGVNPEVLRLVIQDQWDRGNDMFGGRKPAESLNAAEVDKHDVERQAAVRKLLAEGKIQSALDYEFAALIFQHSGKSADLILAHTLAVTAVGKGGRAKPMAAATFDRYLWSVKQPQVFGTQFQFGPDRPWTMEPYDRTALTDSMRAVWCVVPLAEQEVILKDLRDGKPLRSTEIPDCK